MRKPAVTFKAISICTYAFDMHGEVFLELRLSFPMPDLYRQNDTMQNTEKWDDESKGWRNVGASKSQQVFSLSIPWITWDHLLLHNSVSKRPSLISNMNRKNSNDPHSLCYKQVSHSCFAFRWPCDLDQGQGHWKWYKMMEVLSTPHQDRYKRNRLNSLCVMSNYYTQVVQPNSLQFSPCTR